MGKKEKKKGSGKFSCEKNAQKCLKSKRQFTPKEMQ